MMTGTKEIKDYLKKCGFDTRKISVKHRWCGYSESYDITLLDKNISKNAVYDATRRFESYDRDEVTGEILLGGNTYILVDYDWRLD